MICTWTAPCDEPDCYRCQRRRALQVVKAERAAPLRAIPLSVLRGVLHPPPIEPEDLVDAGDFLIVQGYLRPSLDAIGRGQQVVLQVEPLQGELAGLPFLLVLAALELRVQVVDLLRRTSGPIGPCVLVRRYLSPRSGIWSLCGREPDGSVWDSLGTLPDDPPAPGADPIPFL